MSRSYRKRPYVKDSSPEFRKWNKKEANRAVRSSIDPEDIPSSPGAYKKMYESYNIYDYVCRCTWEEFQNWHWVKDSDMTEKEKFAKWKREYWSK